MTNVTDASHCCHRLWECAFQHADPIWANTGVKPAATDHQGKLWKQLTATAVHLKATGGIGGDVLCLPSASVQKDPFAMELRWGLTPEFCSTL